MQKTKMKKVIKPLEKQYLTASEKPQTNTVGIILVLLFLTFAFIGIYTVFGMAMHGWFWRGLLSFAVLTTIIVVALATEKKS